MVIEDDAAYAQLLRRALESSGVPRQQIRVVHDGEKAIEVFEALDGEAESPMRAPPSFVLLDEGLPGRSGLEVLAWLRGERRLAGLPVFMLSGSEVLTQIVSAFELKVQSYFIKPMDFSELQAVIEGILAYWYRRSQGTGVRLSRGP
jgi:DNA-binding response OmpR family regulator